MKLTLIILMALILSSCYCSDKYLYVKEDSNFRTAKNVQIQIGDTLIKVGNNKYYNLSEERRQLTNIELY